MAVRKDDWVTGDLGCVDHQPGQTGSNQAEVTGEKSGVMRMMMQVKHNKQVMIKSGGVSRSKPVRLSPAESNLVKPFKLSSHAAGPERETVQKWTESTTKQIVNRAFQHRPNGPERSKLQTGGPVILEVLPAPPDAGPNHCESAIGTGNGQAGSLSHLASARDEGKKSGPGGKMPPSTAGETPAATGGRGAGFAI
jgi:hypothetical protein